MAHSAADSYPPLARIFHRVALGSDLVGEAMFDLEAALFSRCRELTLGPPVYVCGLARAGTTVLMRALHATGLFASLTYRDMPLVMAPNLWGAIADRQRRDGGTRERAHGDGIAVGVDSPEALDEVFWRVHCGADYIRRDALTVHGIDAGTHARFVLYRKLVCHRRGRTRYLSKNNNNLLRLESLAARDRGAVFLVPFRDPLAQAASLLAMHRRFLDGPDFQARYMTDLAHHEFGATHRPYCFTRPPAPGLTPVGIDYWLDRWADAYGYVAKALDRLQGTVVPVCYERLCREPAYWRRICGICGVPASTPADFALSRRGSPLGADAGLLAEARRTYDGLAAAP